MEQPGEQHPQALSANTEPAQPTADSAHRTVQHRGNAAMPSTGHLGQQRPTDNGDRVGSAHQRRCRQQHVRAAALRARRPARTQRHDRCFVPDSTFSRMAPRAQFAGATRTAKFTARQELVDLERVRTYDQQRVPFCTKRRPSLPAKEIGRAAAFPRRRHALVANQEGQPTGLPLKTIITVNDAEYLHVVSQRVAQHPCPDAGSRLQIAGPWTRAQRPRPVCLDNKHGTHPSEPRVCRQALAQ